MADRTARGHGIVTNRPIVATIGHGDAGFDDIRQVLDDCGVQMIVDVRSHPFSRHAPDFQKVRLEEFAAEAGLGYRWLGSHLGGVPLRDGEPAPIRSRHLLDAGLTEVVALTAGNRVALLCAERDPGRCHRSTVLAPALEERGFQVVHLLEDGSFVAHQRTLPW